MSIITYLKMSFNKKIKSNSNILSVLLSLWMLIILTSTLPSVNSVPIIFTPEGEVFVPPNINLSFEGGAVVIVEGYNFNEFSAVDSLVCTYAKGGTILSATTAYFYKSICPISDLTCLYDYSETGYFSNNYQIACNTPVLVYGRSLNDENVDVHLYISNLYTNQLYACETYLDNCKITFSNLMTPIITRITPQNLVYDSVVSMLIYPSQKIVNGKDLFTPMESGVTSVRIGRNVCFVENYMKQGTVIEPFYELKCRFKATTESISDFRVQFYFGGPSVPDSFTIYQYDPDFGKNPEGQIMFPWYKNKTRAAFVIRSEITAIEPKWGFKTGGQTIKIHGNGFSTDNTTVYVGENEKCEISKITSSTIECKVPKVTQDSTLYDLPGMALYASTYPANKSFEFYDLYELSYEFNRKVITETSLNDVELVNNHAIYSYLGKILFPWKGFYTFIAETNAETLVVNPANRSPFVLTGSKSHVIEVANFFSKIEAYQNIERGESIHYALGQNHIYNAEENTEIEVSIYSIHKYSPDKHSNYFKIGLLHIPDDEVKCWDDVNGKEVLPFRLFNLYRLEINIPIKYDTYHLIKNTVFGENRVTCGFKFFSITSEMSISSVYFGLVDTFEESRLYIEKWSFIYDYQTAKVTAERQSIYCYNDVRKAFFESRRKEQDFKASIIQSAINFFDNIGYYPSDEYHLYLIIIDEDTTISTFNQKCLISGGIIFREDESKYYFYKSETTSGSIGGKFSLAILEDTNDETCSTSEEEDPMGDPMMGESKEEYSYCLDSSDIAAPNIRVTRILEIDIGISAIKLTQMFNTEDILFNQIEVELVNESRGNYIYYIKNSNQQNNIKIRLCNNWYETIIYTSNSQPVGQSNNTLVGIRQYPYKQFFFVWPIPTSMLKYDRLNALKNAIVEKDIVLSPKIPITDVDAPASYSNLYNIKVVSNSLMSICYPVNCTYEIIQQGCMGSDSTKVKTCIPTINEIEYDSTSTIIKVTTEIDFSSGIDEDLQLRIYVGTESCLAEVNLISSYIIQCKINPIGGSNLVKVISKYGTFNLQNGVNNTTVIPIIITNVSPSTGSKSGGTLIAITGLNFPPSFSSVDTFIVKIYGNEATIVNTSRNMIQAYVPTVACQSGGGSPPKRFIQQQEPTLPVVVMIGTESGDSSLFEYNSSEVCTTIKKIGIDTVATSSVTKYFAPGKPQFMTIAFSSAIGSYSLSNMSFALVSLGSRKQTQGKKIPLEIVTTSLLSTDTKVKVRYNGGEQDTYSLKASLTASESVYSYVSIDNNIIIHSICPQQGSILGGTRVTMKGVNFINDTDNQQIYIGDLLVTDIQEITSTQIIFFTPAPGSSDEGMNLEVTVIQNTIYSSSYSPDCTSNYKCSGVSDHNCPLPPNSANQVYGNKDFVSFRYAPEKTPEVTKITCADDFKDPSVPGSSCYIVVDDSTVTLHGRSLVDLVELTKNTVAYKASYPTIYPWGVISVNFDANKPTNDPKNADFVTFSLVSFNSAYKGLNPLFFKTPLGTVKNNSGLPFINIQESSTKFTCTNYIPKTFSNYGTVMTIFCSSKDLYAKGSVVTITTSTNEYQCKVLEGYLIPEIRSINANPMTNIPDKSFQCVLIGEDIQLQNFEVNVKYIPAFPTTKIHAEGGDSSQTYSNLNIQTLKIVANNQVVTQSTVIPYLNKSRALLLKFYLDTNNVNLELRMILNWTTKIDFTSVSLDNSLAVYEFNLTNGLPSGQVTINLHADNIGFVGLLNKKSELLLNIPLFYDAPSSLFQVLSSYYGGESYRITGFNFKNTISTTESNDTFESAYSNTQSVTVCGITSTITYSTSKVIEFNTPKLISWEIFKDSLEIEKTEELTGSFYENIINYYTLENVEYSSLLKLRETSNPFKNIFSIPLGSYVGIKVTQENVNKGFKIYCTSIAIFASTLSKPYDFNGGVIEGSQDGISWKTLKVLPKWFPLMWTRIKISYENNSENRIFNFIRLKLQRETFIAGIKFYGKLVIDNSASSNISCTVQVKDSGGSYLVSNLRVLYQNSKTLFITSSSPYPASSTTNASPVSNVNLTINNVTSDFSFSGITASNISIKVFGIPAVTNTITLSNNVITFSVPAVGTNFIDTDTPLFIQIKGYGQIPANKLLIEYIDYWDNVNTWGGEFLPSKGASVTIKSKTVILNISEITVNTIYIDDGGVLVLEDVRDYIINLHNIIITNGGELRIGTYEKPFTHKVQFNFKSLPSNDNFATVNRKFSNNMIASYNGKISIHSEIKSVLKSTVSDKLLSNNKTLYVTGLVDWEEGDEIGASFLDDVYTIKSIEKNTTFNHSIITLNENFGSPDYSNDNIHVVLLSRNIILAPIAANMSYNFGPYILSTADNFVDTSYESYIQISGVYFKYCGQGSFIGKFPISLQHLGEQVDSYILYNSFANSYNGAINLNGTNGINVSYNTTYRVSGHSILLESGMEFDNLIDNNIFINNFSQPLSSSIKIASILIRNFDNEITNNIIFGNSSGAGILASIPKKVMGAFAAGGRNICLNETPLRKFEKNTILHCSIGLYIETRYNPKFLQCLEDNLNNDISVTSKALFSQLQIKYNTTGIKFNEIGNFEISKCEVIGNKVGISLTKLVQYNVNSLKSPNFQYNINNTTISPTLDLNTNFKIGIQLPYSDGLLIDNVDFRDFSINKDIPNDEVYCISNFPIEKENVSSSGGKTHLFKLIRFVNSNKMIKWYEPRNDIIIDLDGSLTKNYSLDDSTTNKRYIIPELNYVGAIDECYTLSEWLDSAVCTSEVIILRVTSSLELNFEIDFNFIALDKNDNNFALDLSRTVQEDLNTLVSPKILTTGSLILGNSRTFADWVIPLVTNYSYFTYLRSDKKEDPQELTIKLHEYYNKSFAPINLIIQYYNQINFQVKKNDVSISSVSPDLIFPKVLSSFPLDFARYYDDRNYYNLYFRLAGNSQIQSAQITYTTCTEDCQKISSYEDKIRRWSNPLDWPTGKIPEDGDSVLIEKRWRMMIDTSTANLIELRINGLLFPDSSKDNLEINSFRIIIESGKLEIGTIERPFVKNIKINLLGKESSDKKINIGSTSFSNFPNNLVLNLGDLDINGEDRSPYFSKLFEPCFQTLNIWVEPKLNWRENDEIIISNSGHDMKYHERHTISKYDPDTGEIILKNLIQFKHFGDSTNTTVNDAFTGSKVFDERSEVIMITRNIQFSAIDEEWGASLISTNVNANGQNYVSQLNITHAQFNYFGQYSNSTVTASPGISIIGVPKNKPKNNIIRGVSILNSLYTSIKISSTNNFDLNNIVIYDTVKHGLLIEDCKDFNIIDIGVFIVRNNSMSNFIEETTQTTTRVLKENNKKINNKNKNNANSYYNTSSRYLQSLEKIDITSCYYICPDQNVCSNIIKENLICGGSEMFGYISQIESCNKPDSSFKLIKSFSTNGGVLLTNPNNEECVKIMNIHSFNNVGYGVIISLEAKQLIIKNSILSNNLIGISVNTGWNNFTCKVELSNLLVMGNNHDNPQSIDQSLSYYRNSIKTTRQIGIMLPTISQSQRFPPLLNKDFPLEKPCCESNLDGRVQIKNILFMNWEDQSKIDSSAISNNYYNKDKLPITEFDNIILRNVLRHSFIYINRETDITQPCVSNNCSNLYHKFIKFKSVKNSIYTELDPPVINPKWIVNDTTKELRYPIQYYNSTDVKNKLEKLLEDLDDYDIVDVVNNLLLSSNNSNGGTVVVSDINISELTNKLVLTNNWSKIYNNDKIFADCIKNNIELANYWNSTLCSSDNWFYLSFTNTDSDSDTKHNDIKIYLNNALFTILTPDTNKDFIDKDAQTLGNYTWNSTSYSYKNNFGGLLSNYYLSYTAVTKLPKRFSLRIHDSYFSTLTSSKKKLITFNYEDEFGFIVKNTTTTLKPTLLKEGDDFIPEKCGDYTFNNKDHLITLLLSNEDDCLVSVRKANTLMIWLYFNMTINDWNSTHTNNLSSELSKTLNIPNNLIHFGNIYRGSAILDTYIFDYNYSKDDDDIVNEDLLNLNTIADRLIDVILNDKLNVTPPVMKLNYSYSIVDEDPDSVFGDIKYNKTSSVIYDIQNNKTIPIDNSNSTVVENTSTSSSEEESVIENSEEKTWVEKYWWVILLACLGGLALITLIIVYMFCCGKKTDDSEEIVPVSNNNDAIIIVKEAKDTEIDEIKKVDESPINSKYSKTIKKKTYEDDSTKQENEENTKNIPHRGEFNSNELKSDNTKDIMLDNKKGGKPNEIKIVATNNEVNNYDNNKDSYSKDNDSSIKFENQIDKNVQSFSKDPNYGINQFVNIEDLEVIINRSDLSYSRDNYNKSYYEDRSRISYDPHSNSRLKNLTEENRSNKFKNDLSKENNDLKANKPRNKSAEKDNSRDDKINKNDKSLDKSSVSKSKIIDFADYNEFDKEYNESKTDEKEIAENNKVFKERLKSDYKL